MFFVGFCSLAMQAWILNLTFEVVSWERFCNSHCDSYFPLKEWNKNNFKHSWIKLYVETRHIMNDELGIKNNKT